jgi:cytochrome c-type biogenesis protein CcmF
LKIWTVLLAILTFSFSLLGTFLVRSGVLTSVHAFATDPARGVFILGILVVFIGGALALFGLRAGTLKAGGMFAPISREGSLVLNNLFLTTAAATVLVGTLYPLLLESVTGTKISVGPPFFNLTFGPLMVPLLLAVPFGPLLAWKRGDLAGAAQRLYFAAGGSLLVGLGVVFIQTGAPVLAGLGIALGVFLILGALTDLALRAGIGRVGAGVAWSRLIGLPRSAFGSALGHMGLGVTVIGIVAASVFSTETVIAMKPGDTATAGGYELRFDGIRDYNGPNYTSQSGEFTVMRGGVEVAKTASAKRFYQARGMPTTEAGILTFGASQLYIALGDPEANGGLVVRIWWKSWVTFIWYGTVVMMIGGMLSLSDRRLRIGAPNRAKARKKTVEAAA